MRSGSYPVAVRIESDRLPRDDGAFGVIEVSEGVRVLVVDGDPGTSRFTSEAGFLAAALAKLKDAEGARPRLRIADAAHPAFEPFRGIEGSSLEQVGFDRFFEIEPRRGARIAARFTDPASTPAIIDRAVGKGRSALFNLSADRDWNDWPADPSYPVVLQEWARYLARRGAAESAFIVGEPMSWEAAPGVEYDVAAPGGKVETVRPESGRATLAAARDAGLYRIVPRAVAGSEAPRRSLEPFWRAGRLDPAESDLEPAGEARLRSALGSAGVEFSMGRDVDVDVFRKSEEGETWRALASCAGIFLVLELLAAWWFGRR